MLKKLYPHWHKEKREITINVIQRESRFVSRFKKLIMFK